MILRSSEMFRMYCTDVSIYLSFQTLLPSNQGERGTECLKICLTDGACVRHMSTCSEYWEI